MSLNCYISSSLQHTSGLEVSYTDSYLVQPWAVQSLHWWQTCTWSSWNRKLSPLHLRNISPYYVDDILEILKRDAVESFTEHLNNSIDETGSIKFTYEMEHEGSLLFLDILITRQQNGQLKLTVYRKKTHTDQYLHFESHHPLEHKITVIRTLVARSENLVTEKCDKDKDREHIKSALGACVLEYSQSTEKDGVHRTPTKQNKKVSVKSASWVFVLILYYFLLVSHCKYSSILYRFRVIDVE